MSYPFLRSTRTPAAFLAGLLVGVAVMAVSAQSSRLAGNYGINHVGIVVDRLPEAIAMYGKAFGFGEAAVLRDENGQPTLAFIQVSRNTFIELSPSSDTRRAGLDHFGLHVEDLNATVADLRQRGTNVEDPRVGRTISFITSTTDPVGVRMEMSEIRDDSMLGKAIAGW